MAKISPLIKFKKMISFKSFVFFAMAIKLDNIPIPEKTTAKYI